MGATVEDKACINHIKYIPTPYALTKKKIWACVTFFYGLLNFSLLNPA